MNTIEPSDTSSDKPSSDSGQQDTNPTQSKKNWLRVVILLSLATGAIMLWRSLMPTNQTAQSATAQQQETPPKPVTTIALETGNGTRQFQLLGQVESRERATIRSQIDGLIEQILVQPGDRVTAGMTIAIIDDSDQQLAVAEARARLAQERSNLARLEVGTRPEIIAQRQATVRSTLAREEEAQDNVNRLSNLVVEGAESERVLVEAKATVDNAQGDRLEAEAALAEAVAGPIREQIDAQKANVAVAEAALNQAELSLSRTEVKALANGVVQERQTSPGDYLEVADPIASIVAGNNLDVFLELPEDLSGTIRPGMSVELNAPALPEWRERATITGVVPTADAATRRQRVRVRLDNPPSGLLSGMAVTGALAIRANSPSLIISRDALTRRQDRWLVFTVADGKAQEIEVELIADMGQKVAIDSEQLRAGQSIVLQGGDGLSEGATVKVTKEG
jgi:HlyD family secretion protein